MRTTILLFCLTAFTGRAQTVTDIDGNTYGTVAIGTQTWLNANLKTTRFSNGDTIPTTLPATLNITGEPGPVYQWSYNGNDSLVATYGRLYTWYAAADDRNVCPAGWHVPSVDEFSILFDYLGGHEVAGGKLKEPGFDHWLYPNTGATNESGFNGVANGHRNLYGDFNGLKSVSDMWTITESLQGAWDRDLNYDTDSVSGFADDKAFAFAVRCLKDEPMNDNHCSASVFPVPARNELYVAMEHDGPLTYAIIALNGPVISEGTLEPGDSVIDVSHLTGGVYILQITSSACLAYQLFIKAD